MKVYLGSDHRGYTLKKNIANYLRLQGYETIDVGSYSPRPVDYPRIVQRLVSKLRPGAQGILVCGSGAGMEMGANKYAGIRAANAWSPRVAQAVRREDDGNVLCLAADFLTRAVAQRIVLAWLRTSPSKAKRYSRRIRMVSRLGHG